MINPKNIPIIVDGQVKKIVNRLGPLMYGNVSSYVFTSINYPDLVVKDLKQNLPNFFDIYWQGGTVTLDWSKYK